jgi:MFS family permease
MLIGRVVQAMGGGGIMPIATAEFGTSFPENKRGMALGLVGGVYGIANILGASAGSAIMDVFGTSRWDLIFLVNVPIAAAIIAFGIFFLPNNRGSRSSKIDILGIPLLTVMILSLLYGLRNIDFFDLAVSIRSVEVYPFLLGFIVLLPVLLAVERRAEEPVLGLGYFTNRNTLITLIMSFFAGVLMMGMVFVPQLAENALRIASGSGGYFVAVLGIFAGFSAPVSGSLIDKFGPKRILLAGFLVSLLGALLLIFFTIPHPSTAAVLFSLAIMGFGLGFTMGTPLNYMMLQNSPADEAGSALATLSLIRSIGTAIAPAIMIGFIAHAGASSQDRIMALLPPVDMPRLEQAEKLDAQFAALQADPVLSGMMAGMEIPSFAFPESMAFSMDAQDGSTASAMPAEMVVKLRSADVTTITDRIKEMAQYMFDQKKPGIVSQAQNGIRMGTAKMQEALSRMPSGDRAMPPMMQATRGKIVAIISTMEDLETQIPQSVDAAGAAYLDKLESLRPQIDSAFQVTLNTGFLQMYILVAAISLLAAAILLFYRKNAPRMKESSR